MNRILFFMSLFLLIGCNSNQPKKKVSDIDSLVLKEKQIAISKLDSSKFEILEEDISPRVTNYYILYKGVISQDSIRKFVHIFRDVHCAPSNINIIDSKNIYPLIKEYPLKGEKYIKVADHFVAESSFDSPNDVWWYPYQDFYYKEQGGKNWKKEPIE
ncbi:hypothetical protein [uncultured Bacteroides sp.]|uniref:hypothetical protein n=1 Tax=uncultured Bacteroides sp. TaxID=162156 RepID=UPI0025E466D5|nr:hypothetical protein [uncultured Bacteroides sp.]